MTEEDAGSRIRDPGARYLCSLAAGAIVSTTRRAVVRLVLRDRSWMGLLFGKAGEVFFDRQVHLELHTPASLLIHLSWGSI